MIIASWIFSAVTIFLFTYLDLKYRIVKKRYIWSVFNISFFIYFFVDYMIFGTVAFPEIIIGGIGFGLTYLLFTAGVISKIIGPADVRIISAFVFFTPVYTYPLFGKGTIPPIDFFLNFMLLIIPTIFIFKKAEPSRETPAVAAISAAIILTMTFGNLPIVIFLYLQ